MEEKKTREQRLTAPKRQQAVSSSIEREVVNLKDWSFEAGAGIPVGV